MAAVPRFTEPTRTRDRAPSHSPPDVRYAPGLKLAKCLGWFSIGLGVAQVVAPRMMARWIGVNEPNMLPLYGMREIVTGVGILRSERPIGWMWGRVAGDAQDLATLGAAMFDRDNPHCERTCAAALAVAGVTAADVLCATQLSVAAKIEAGK